MQSSKIIMPCLLSAAVILLLLIYLIIKYINVGKKKEKTKQIEISNQVVHNYHKNDNIIDIPENFNEVKEEQGFYWGYNDYNDPSSDIVSHLYYNQDSKKISEEQLYSAELVNTDVNYINYIVNPLPSYEQLVNDSKIIRSPIGHTPSQFKIKGKDEEIKSAVVITPAVPVVSNNFNNTSTNENNNSDDPSSNQRHIIFDK